MWRAFSRWKKDLFFYKSFTTSRKVYSHELPNYTSVSLNLKCLLWKKYLFIINTWLFKAIGNYSLDVHIVLIDCHGWNWILTHYLSITPMRMFFTSGRLVRILVRKIVTWHIIWRHQQSVYNDYIYIYIYTYIYIILAVPVCFLVVTNVITEKTRGCLTSEICMSRFG